MRLGIQIAWVFVYGVYSSWAGKCCMDCDCRSDSIYMEVKIEEDKGFEVKKALCPVSVT